MKVKKLNKEDTIYNKKNITIMLIITLVASTLLALGAFFLSRSAGGDVVLHVGDLRITKAQEQRYKDSAKRMGLDGENVRGELIDYLKNKHIAQKHNLPMNTLFIDEQWSSVVSERSIDSFAARKLSVHADEKWAYILKYNKLYHVLSRSLDNDALVGAVYHIPYSATDKERSVQIAQEVKVELSKGNGASLMKDQQLLKNLLDSIPQASASRSGGYILFKDSSGLRMGGTFGIRGGTIPLDMADRLFKEKVPVVSDVIDVNESELYVVHVTDEVRADEQLPDRLAADKQGIRVVEYDK